MKSTGVLAFAFVLVSAVAAAQHEGHSHSPGEERELGRVHFPVSCGEAAQTEFARGVAMLHSFWYEEAEKAFARAAQADADCAMAYWGVAMSQYHPIWSAPTPAELDKGKLAVSKAKALGGKTDREKAYIEAIGVFYDGSDRLDHKARAAAYERAMEKVSRAYPADHEAAAFYAVALLWTLSASPNDETNPRKAAAVLDPIANQMPDHPGVLHYYIHAYDTPALAPLALNAARSYAKVAPAVPHALHMPSHIFTRLGLWKESIESNRAAESAGRDFERRTGMTAAWDERVHAMDYLEYAELQMGAEEDALGVLERVREIGKAEPESLKAAFALAAVPVRYVVEGHRWAQAAALEAQPRSFPWDRFLIGPAMIHFARALGRIHSGDLTGSAREVAELESLRDRLKKEGTGYDWSTVAETLRLEAAGWLANARGRRAEAGELLRRAADLEDSTEKNAVTPGAIVPAREQLAGFLLEAGHPADALREYESALRSAPNRFNGLYGAGRAAENSGQPAKARAYYQSLLAISDPASRRPEVAEAKAFVARPAPAGPTRLP